MIGTAPKLLAGSVRRLLGCNPRCPYAGLLRSLVGVHGPLRLFCRRAALPSSNRILTHSLCNAGHFPVDLFRLRPPFSDLEPRCGVNSPAAIDKVEFLPRQPIDPYAARRSS